MEELKAVLMKVHNWIANIGFNPGTDYEEIMAIDAMILKALEEKEPVNVDRFSED